MSKLLHTLYGLGAFVILCGAAIKVSGVTIYGIAGTEAITAGLIAEAGVFLMYSFDYTGVPEGEGPKWKWVIKKEKYDNS